MLDGLRSIFHSSGGRLDRDAFIEALLRAAYDNGGDGKHAQTLSSQTTATIRTKCLVLLFPSHTLSLQTSLNPACATRHVVHGSVRMALTP